MAHDKDRIQKLEAENNILLSELEQAYKNMAMILEQSEQEMEIAYKELDNRYHSLENLYEQLSNKENMLIHLEKLSSIGQFVTEIIHELRNPLSIISGYTDLALLEPEIPDSVHSKIVKIPAQVERMLNYLHRFKSMAYKGKEDFRTIDLNENLREFLTTIEIIKPKNIQIVSEIDDEKLIVTADPYQILQVFLNLAKNAFDAMEASGDTFKIKSKKIDKKWLLNENDLGNIDCQDEESWQSIVNNHKEFVLLEFCDNGSGIPEDIIINIFEAFFTTKGRGKGTGLGMSIAKDITLRHNANLYIKSVIDQGTTFQFVIPIEEVQKGSYLITDDKVLFI